MSALPDFSGIDVDKLSDEDVMALLEATWAAEDAEKYGKFASLFPDEGPLRRELYARHLEFFHVGGKYRERTFMAGNRVGKTVAGAYELTCHLTGEYPHWWNGKRFRHPIRAWAAGDSNETTRDIIQAELMGEVAFDHSRKFVDGTGMIPIGSISKLPSHLTWKAGVADLIDTVKIKHAPTGEFSTLGFKSYAQGRKSFQGTKQHVIWFDEEPAMDVYGEALIRTATTGGVIMLTYTPLSGMSDVVLQFLPSDQRPEAE